MNAPNNPIRHLTSLQASRRRVLAGLLAAPFASAYVPLASGATQAQGDDVSELVEGNTAFALDLYAELRQANDGNLLFSPYSVSQALAMTWAGADGDTEEQMAEALSFTLSQRALHDAFSELNDHLTDAGNAQEDLDQCQSERGLRIANALWGEQSYPFSAEFSEDLEEHYEAGLQLVDFVNAPEDAREEINDWVADQTEDRIEDIIPLGVIDSMTRLVLANAVWFYGPWLHTFKPDNTEDDTFFLLDGSELTVPFMTQREELPYAELNGFQAIELPYEGSEFRFTVLLPDKGGLEAFEDQLDTDTLAAAFDELSLTNVDLFLPKFEFTFASTLAPTLNTLGMTDAFDRDLADFSGMVEGTPDEPIFIGDVLHKAFIAVDENGTEAAAATVVVGPTSAQPEPEAPTEVRIDRPFIFAIRDSVTGTLLFIGRVLDSRG